MKSGKCGSGTSAVTITITTGQEAKWAVAIVIEEAAIVMTACAGERRFMLSVVAIAENRIAAIAAVATAAC